MEVDFWSLEPEVAGELGSGSTVDTSVHPPRVHKLQYQMSGWLGDELLESFPCYIVSDAVAATLRRADLTGFELDSVDVVTSEEFVELYPGRQLPGFRWLKVTGSAGADDFGVSPEFTLVVSGRALSALRQHRLAHCDVEKYDGRARVI